MREFGIVREAKDYLAGRIAEEAKRQGAPLTEVERKMLYFSETGSTLPEVMEANAEFDRDYNDVEYEQKIGGLVRRIQERQNLENEDQRQEWCSAIEKLRVEDDYLLVLIDMGCSLEPEKPSRWGRLGPWLPDLAGTGARPPGDTGRLILVAIVVSTVVFVVIVVWGAILLWLSR
jgi:hypothetical protein